MRVIFSSLTSGSAIVRYNESERCAYLMGAVLAVIVAMVCVACVRK